METKQSDIKVTMEIFIKFYHKNNRPLEYLYLAEKHIIDLDPIQYLTFIQQQNIDKTTKLFLLQETLQTYIPSIPILKVIIQDIKDQPLKYNEPHNCIDPYTIQINTLLKYRKVNLSI